MDIYITVDTRKYFNTRIPYAWNYKWNTVGDMEYKHLNSSVHRVVCLIKVLNQNPQFQHLNT